MAGFLFDRGRILNGILVLFLFFMPWMEVSCSGTRLFRASGSEMAAGFEFQGPDMGTGGNPFAPSTAPKQKAKPTAVKGWPLLFLVPVAAVGLVAFGLMATTRSRRNRVAGILSAVGAGTMVIKMMSENAEFQKQAGDAGGMLRLDWQPAFWLTLLLLAGWACVEFFGSEAAEAAPAPPEPAN